MPDLQPEAGQRLALGVAYRGTHYCGWQRQPDPPTVQQALEDALSAFAATPVTTVCAGRTDTGVHACNQVVHLDAPVARDLFSWVRGTNRFLPDDVAVQWCQPVAADFHARRSAFSRRYRYVLREAAVRPALEAGLAGWVFTPLDEARLNAAAAAVCGTHDFTAFRAAQCQALSPVKTLHRIDIARQGHFWRFDFEANAFLHHMVRNLMGSLLAVGSGRRPVDWIAEVLASRDRRLAAPTFSADGLYFLGPRYDARHGLPERTPVMDWMP